MPAERIYPNPWADVEEWIEKATMLAIAYEEETDDIVERAIRQIFARFSWGMYDTYTREGVSDVEHYLGRVVKFEEYCKNRRKGENEYD